MGEASQRAWIRMPHAGVVQRSPDHLPRLRPTPATALPSVWRYAAPSEGVVGMAKVGVLLLNLGGPERIQDVGPFLYNLFSDPEIIRLPIPALQKPLAWLISSLRSSKSQEAYRSIGGGSPLRRITEQQARELQSSLRQRGVEATSYVAMRYWHPFTESAVADIKADHIEAVVVLPLYPQFSISTSGSSFRELQRLRQADAGFQSLPIRCIRSWYDHPGYIEIGRAHV